MTINLLTYLCGAVLRVNDSEMLMKVRYCGKYQKYVSVYHCEFFNEGKTCEFYENRRWNRLKDLIADRNRPKWDVRTVIKPYMCKVRSGSAQASP